MRHGRKLKITDSTIRDLTAALAIGATIDIACAYAGVSTGSYYNWYHAGEEALEKLEQNPDTELSEKERLYLKFFDKVEKTKAYAAVGWLDVVNSAASSSPEWARWLLKARYPDGYSERQEVGLDVSTGGQPLDDAFKQALLEVYGEEGSKS